MIMIIFINWCIYNILHASYLLKMYCYLLKINNNKEIIKSSTHRESINTNINFDEKKNLITVFEEDFFEYDTSPRLNFFYYNDARLIRRKNRSETAT